MKQMLDDDVSDKEIMESLGMKKETFNNYKTYLKELEVADLTSEETAHRRSEMYVELLDATSQAKEMFEDLKKKGKDVIGAKRMFSAWLDAINLRMKLYGLDNVKVEAYTQINQLAQFQRPDKVNAQLGSKIAKLIKDSHEQSVRDKYEEEEV